VYQAESEMQRLGGQLNSKEPDEQLTRILRQCGRELLLLQASDWPFMIGTGSTPDHARQRVARHFANFQHCRRMAERYLTGEAISEQEWRLLAEEEQQDALFPALDPWVFWEKSTD
jgi:1,4-alpha-glucan branching enzyme